MASKIEEIRMETGKNQNGDSNFSQKKSSFFIGISGVFQGLK